MTFLAPAWLLLAALALPVILLWFLRQRREPREVPTVFLWRRAAEEQRVSPLLRRLEQSLLLVLEITALLLLAAAAADLVFSLGLRSEARRVAIVIDTSASMGTRDGPGGLTRLDAAKERAGVLLETLRAGDRVTLVAFDRTARVLAPPTDDHAPVRALLAALVPADLPTDATAALAAVAAVDADRPEVFLFSDGAFDAPPALPSALAEATFHFVGAGGATANAGIVDLGLAGVLEGAPRLTVRVEGDAAAGPRVVSLLRDGVVLDAVDGLDPAESPLARFDLSAAPPGPLTVRLDPPDALPADDRAFLVLAPEPTRRVLLVTPGDPVLARLRDLHPSVEFYTVAPADFAAADPASFDFLVYDGVVPDGGLPRRPGLFLACAPPGRGVGFAAPVETPAVVDWRRGHPLNREVDWDGILFARAAPVAADPGIRPVPLLEIPAGPILAELPGDPPAIIAGFRLPDTNLSLRPAFPVFLLNLLEAAFGGGPAAFARTGDLLSAPAAPGDAPRVETPDGTTVPATPLADGTAALAATGRAGFYRFRNAAGSLAAASLLSSAETRTPAAPSVPLGGREHRSSPESVEARLPARRLLVLLALAALALEWLLWGRRRA